MSRTQYRNHEEDQKRVRHLEKILKEDAEPDFDLPKYIFVTVPHFISDESTRSDITNQGWIIDYSEYTGNTTIKIPHCKKFDFVDVWTFIGVCIFMFILYHVGHGIYYFRETKELVEVI
jgi:hypothetical protein